MKTIKFISTFLILQLVACFIAWCGGFDFDTRSTGVGLTVLISVGFGAFVSGIFWLGEI